VARLQTPSTLCTWSSRQRMRSAGSGLKGGDHTWPGFRSPSTLCTWSSRQRMRSAGSGLKGGDHTWPGFKLHPPSAPGAAGRGCDWQAQGTRGKITRGPASNSIHPLHLEQQEEDAVGRLGARGPGLRACELGLRAEGNVISCSRRWSGGRCLWLISPPPLRGRCPAGQRGVHSTQDASILKPRAYDRYCVRGVAACLNPDRGAPAPHLTAPGSG